MKKIRIAQIGVEHDHAQMTMTALLALPDIFEVVGYCDPEESGVLVNGQVMVTGYLLKKGLHILGEDAYAGVPKYTISELLAMDDLDAVAIETSETNLFKYALLFAEKGIHVHMDKPGGLEYADFVRLTETCKKTGATLHLGYMYRYNPEYKRLLQEVRDGKYGEIYSVECHMDCKHPDQKRDWLKKYPGGMMFFLGCHLVDIIYTIMGEPEEVLALNTSTGINGAQGEDYGFAVFRYPHGVSFAKTCAAEPGGFLRRQLVVCGEKGTVQFMPFEAYEGGTGSASLYTRVRTVDTDLGNWGTDGTYRETSFDRYMPMLKAFASYVRGEAENPYTSEYELRLYRLLMKACGKEIG